jgi:carbamoyl-phosphate synthase large subunit
MIVRIFAEARQYAKENGYPIVLHSRFSLNGAGVGVATDEKSLTDLFAEALKLSPTGEVYLERL